MLASQRRRGFNNRLLRHKARYRSADPSPTPGNGPRPLRSIASRRCARMFVAMAFPELFYCETQRCVSSWIRELAAFVKTLPIMRSTQSILATTDHESWKASSFSFGFGFCLCLMFFVFFTRVCEIPVCVVCVCVCVCWHGMLCKQQHPQDWTGFFYKAFVPSPRSLFFYLLRLFRDGNTNVVGIASVIMKLIGKGINWNAGGLEIDLHDTRECCDQLIVCILFLIFLIQHNKIYFRSLLL